jgi:S1-C subfamily serine protease
VTYQREPNPVRRAGPATVGRVARRWRTAAPADTNGTHSDDDAGPPTVAVPVVPAEAKVAKQRGLRARVLPRTVLGLALLILAASMGAAFSGAVFYSYYQYRAQKSDDRVNALISGYKSEFDKASAALAAQANTAKGEINSQLGPLRDLQASGQALQTLIKRVAPSMWFVHTLDANGQPSVGSAFAVASTPTQTLLLTSYTTVLAATAKPGPDLFVRQGTTETKVTVWTWDERYDLALIILPQGGVPVLQAAATQPTIGDRVYAASGLGSLGSSATDGIVTDVSASGIQHSAPIGTAYQGGPLLNAAGQVVAVSSRNYAPLNFTSDSVWFAPFIQSACAKVLQCPSGSLGGEPGAQRTG